MEAIKTIDLCKKYGDKTVVSSLNLSVEAGQLYALLGVNGAGKTTTIKMLSCLIKPTSGDAFLHDHSIISDIQAVKAITNVSPQETSIAPNLTVRENLELIAEIYGTPKAALTKKVDASIEEFELAEFANKKAKILSGGWQRRLSIAMALISEPRILFLDEPTLGLDVIARRELWHSIERLKGRVTIILTTHYLEEVEALSDQVGIMAHGKLKAVGTVQELIDSGNYKNFEEAFVSIAAAEGE